MDVPRLSVIIPTYRRAGALAECLRRLEKQTVAKDLEVIVVSDGHDDEARDVAVRPRQIIVRYFEVEKSQQGTARNKGVAEASGDDILFIGDDIFLLEDACERHLEAHEIHGKDGPVAVLGFTTWDPAVGITSVMTWLETSGWQFGYPAISNYGHGFIPEKRQHQFTYTSHISLPLQIAKKMPFRTDVHLYGWEDIEWGMRLRDAGVRLVYEPDAEALHHHRLTLEDSLKRMETLGRSAKEMANSVAGFDRVPKGMKLLAYRILSLLPTMTGRHRFAFLKGLRVRT